MRLICGLFHLDGANARKELLRAMAAQMDVPRLRASLQLWQAGPVGLAVLDFPARGAPASVLPETASAIMAADVRLNEPIALARTLGGGAPVAEDALLLAMLERSGPSGLDQVLGDFALASWNKTTQRLVCARDAFGIRPLAYVHQPGKLFAFASFPKALHGAGIVPKKVDEDALARRMVQAFRADDCLVAGIQRLPPAHFIEVSREGVSLVRYWQLDRAAIGTRQCSPEEAARELRRLVDEAVNCRLPRNAEIGAHLSGGLDSSAIAVLAARRLREEGRTLHAYSFLDRQRNDITLEDETEFVKAVLEQEGDIDWTPIRPPAGLSALGGPMDADKMTGLGAEQPENAVCTRAEEQGVGLVLSGWGGDEGATFNGRGTFAELFLRGRWRTLAREISALGKERGWPRSRIFRGEVLSNLRNALLPASVLDLAKRVMGKDPNLQTLFGRSLSAEARRRLAASGDEGLSMAPDGRENRWRLMTSPHIAERAEVWAQTGARHGLAFAFPLLDRRVVEFSLSLPSELFLRGGFRRRPFRDAMADVLPAQVRLRHQKYMPFPGYMLDLAESKDEFLARIDAYGQNESVRRIIDLAHLRRLVEAFPSPELAREEMRGGDNPAATAMMIAAAHVLAAAAYLEQHGGEQAAPTSSTCSG
jgi:asparagine synthase (glutamine-hydrolysing)